jgi:adenine-specific DNA-methyltransferase
MDYTQKKRNELLALCKEKGHKGYSTKTKEQLIELLSVQPTEPARVSRLNYIGSKFQLLDWLSTTIKEKTQWQSFTGKRVADLFAGTGIVSHFFRTQAAIVVSNDAELYSSIITHAFTRSTYTDTCKTLLARLQKELDEKKYADTIGFITKHYSPYETNERKFFTVDNARRIDYVRAQIEASKGGLTTDEYQFILASLLISADAVSNVPAVYGCFLKAFKAKAMKYLHLQPIHTITAPSAVESNTHHSDVLRTEFLESIDVDMVYLDPPYNERQYSKNYFPLNIIAKTPDQLLQEPPLKGKTGIPTDCFLSPFCKKGTPVETAFDTLFRELKTRWIFLSYNSESIISKEKMLSLMGKYGTATVVERDYKRFKSFEYNNDVAIQEYLFCLEKS